MQQAQPMQQADLQQRMADFGQSGTAEQPTSLYQPYAGQTIQQSGAPEAMDLQQRLGNSMAQMQGQPMAPQFGNRLQQPPGNAYGKGGGQSQAPQRLGQGMSGMGMYNNMMTGQQPQPQSGGKGGAQQQPMQQRSPGGKGGGGYQRPQRAPSGGKGGGGGYQPPNNMPRSGGYQPRMSGAYGRGYRG
jgi:hypothetical protein